jgi:hypothetical protein
VNVGHRPEQAQRLDQGAGGITTAPQTDGRIENYWRSQARSLGFQVEWLERQLRWRTLILGSGLFLMACVSAGVIFLALPPLRQRPEPVASVTLPAPVVATAQPAKRAGWSEPMMQPPPPERTDRRRQSELGSVTWAPEDDLTKPLIPLIYSRNAQSVLTAETRALPPLRADDPADTAAATSTLRLFLSNIKQQMPPLQEVGDPRATGGTSPGVEVAEPPLAALTSPEPPSQALPLPADARDHLPPPAAPLGRAPFSGHGEETPVYPP